MAEKLINILPKGPWHADLDPHADWYEVWDAECNGTVCEGIGTLEIALAIASLPALIEAAKLALDVLSAEAIGTHNPENQEWYESVCKAGDSLRDVLTRIQGGE